jgi:predicted double-glycine peptidase
MPRRLFSAAAPVALLAALLVLPGAASAATLADLWLDVPFVPQQKNGCGAASIAMVMQYWEHHQNQSIRPEADPAQIFRALYAADAHGIYASAMRRYFAERGYRAFAFAGEWTDLEQQLQKGRPLIVALKPEHDSSLHYVVVAGVNDADRLVLFNDPAERKLLKEDRDRFEREWQAAARWTLLAVPAADGN